MEEEMESENPPRIQNLNPSRRVRKMGIRRGLSLQTIVSSSVLLLVCFLLIFSLSSNKAEAREEPTANETLIRRSSTMFSWPWDWEIPKDWFKKSSQEMSAYLEKIRSKIIDKLLQTFGLPPSGDIYAYCVKIARWLSDKLGYFFSNPRARIDTAMEWIIDSVLNPFATMTDGMKAFQRLFRYLHRLRKGTPIDFGKDNPVYKCYLTVFPKCVKPYPYDDLIDKIVRYFLCASSFFDECDLRKYYDGKQYGVPYITHSAPFGPF